MLGPCAPSTPGTCEADGGWRFGIPAASAVESPPIYGALRLQYPNSRDCLRPRDVAWRMDFHSGFRGSTVGLVRLGRIGKAVVKRCLAFGTTVLVYAPHPDMAFVLEHRVRLVTLDALLREADFVALHLPVNAETARFINRERLALMRPTAFLVNTARGALVDEAALYDSLAAGRLAGAGLHTFAEEPPWSSRPLSLPNFILRPHSAASDQCVKRATLNRAVCSILVVARGVDPGPRLLLNPDVLRALPPN